MTKFERDVREDILEKTLCKASTGDELKILEDVY